jgi:hypothetical protein
MSNAPTAEKGLAFGFMPADVVNTLLDIGNWRRRASAMDAFHLHLQQQISKNGIPSSQLPSVMAFVYRLIKDPNFKICMSAMNELIAIVNATPLLPQQHAKDIAPLLVERLCDSKLILRQHAHMVLQTMIAKMGPDATLGALASCIGHFAPRAREEIVNVHICALLTHTTYPFEWAALVTTMLTLMDDPKERVRRSAQEAMCLIADRIPKSRLDNIFMALRCSTNHRNRVAARCLLPARPHLGADGSVQHCIDLEGHGWSTSGGAPQLTPPTPPSGSFKHLPFQVPSPGQFSRSSLAGGAAVEWSVEGGSSGSLGRASQVARPKRSQPAATVPSPACPEQHLPLSYDHGPTVTESPSSISSSAATKIRTRLIASTQRSPGQCKSDVVSGLAGPLEAGEVLDDPQRWHIPVSKSDGARPQPCKHSQAPEMPLPLSPAVPRHAQTGRCMPNGDSELSDMLFELQEHPLSPPSLTALTHTKHLAHGRVPVRSASHVQSAPSSDAPLLSAVHNRVDQLSPSKAIRLESLKRRQAERRAQSAGVILLPPERPSPRDSRHHRRMGCEASPPVVKFDCHSQFSCHNGCDVPLTNAISTLDSPSRARGPQPDSGSKLPRPARRATSVECPSAGGSMSSSFHNPGTPGSLATAPPDFDIGTTMPSVHPERDLAQCLDQLTHANAAKRKELDWVSHQEAVNKMRQLLHHHADTVMATTKDVISAMLPCTAALRSSTAKVALLFFQVYFLIFLVSSCKHASHIL